jgi:hypothetical protein
MQVQKEKAGAGGWTGTDSCCWRGGYFRIGDPLLVVGILLSSRNANVRKWAPKTCQAAASSREGEIKLFAETIFLCQRQKKVDPFSGLRCPENGTGTA